MCCTTRSVRPSRWAACPPALRSTRSSSPRPSIRAALDQLASDRLVDRKPGSGVTVRGISKHDAEEVYEIRVVLEVLATTKAARNMNDDDFEALRQLLEEGQRMNAANDVDGVVRNWDEFNQFIFKMADSPRLQSIIEPLQAYTRYFRNVSARPEIRRNEAKEEHWGNYLAMRFGPEKKIEQVVRTHLRNSYGLISAEMADCGIK